MLFQAGRWEKNQIEQVQHALIRIMDDPNLSEPFKAAGLTWKKNQVVPNLNFVERQRAIVAPLIKFITEN